MARSWEDIQLTLLDRWCGHSDIQSRAFTDACEMLASQEERIEQLERMWRCKGCGATFPSIPHDEDVELCSQCVIVEQQGRRIEQLKERVQSCTDIAADHAAMCVDLERRLAEAENEKRALAFSKPRGEWEDTLDEAIAQAKAEEREEIAKIVKDAAIRASRRSREMVGTDQEMRWDRAAYELTAVTLEIQRRAQGGSDGQ